MSIECGLLLRSIRHADRTPRQGTLPEFDQHDLLPFAKPNVLCPKLRGPVPKLHSGEAHLVNRFVGDCVIGFHQPLINQQKLKRRHLFVRAIVLPASAEQKPDDQQANHTAASAATCGAVDQRRRTNSLHNKAVPVWTGRSRACFIPASDYFQCCTQPRASTLCACPFRSLFTASSVKFSITELPSRKR